MQIFEVKNDTAEILYNCNEENLFLFDFLFIEDEELTIVSQVTDISSTENENLNIATVKFCLSVDKTNRLTKYNGHTPPKNAEVGYLDAAEIIGLFRPKTNAVVWGEYARNAELSVATDFKFLSSGFCTICDKAEQSEIIVKTLVSSLEKTNTRTVILDFDGKYQNIKTTNRATFGKEYRIPLDSKALDYIFENDLNDCSPESKVVIQNIILEIQKYIESVDKGFIPFEMFLQIIMSETKRTANKGLMAFCNKLLNYKYKKIFADKDSQFSMINDCDGSFKLDLSNFDEKFYPLIFESVVSRLFKKFYVIADITKENTRTSTMKSIYEKQNVRLIPVISHEIKYQTKIKAHCNNFAIFAPVEKLKTAERYDIFVEKLKPDEFILYGENSLFVPLLVSIKKQLNTVGLNGEDEITVEDLDDLDKANLELIQKMMKEEQLKKEAATISENDLDDLESLYNPASFVEEKQNSQPKEQENSSIEQPEEIIETEEPQEIEEENERNEINEEEISADEKEEEISEEPLVEEKTEVEEENQEPTSQQEEQPQIQQQEAVEQPISQPVQQQEPPRIRVEQKPVEIKIANQQPQQPQRPLPKANELPVYEPKEVTPAGETDFTEGMRVSHAKYGAGTVEKLIKYGKKTLCSIQFDTLGRRLLDPNITTIEKL